MDKFSLAKFMLENLGLILGLLLVLAATWILPARVRWYVLTAGLAVIAFRAYQLISADKRLKKADEERERLRGELDELGRQRDQMSKDLQKLGNDLNAIKTRQRELARESETLAASGDRLAADKARLDSEMTALDNKDRALMAEIDARESALVLFNQAEEAYQELKRTSH